MPRTRSIFRIRKYEHAAMRQQPKHITVWDVEHNECFLVHPTPQPWKGGTRDETVHF